MSKIRAVDMKFLDDVFGLNTGYVLNFSNKTFGEFFADELNIDIDANTYSQEGTSKAKRLRYFLKVSDSDTSSKTLLALWDYRKLCGERPWERPTVDTDGRFFSIIDRIRGVDNAATTNHPPPVRAYDYEKISQLRDELIALGQYAPQPRGYAFEAWLKKLFNAFHLEARSPFRNHGEQIDGSFVLGHETYLLEAKWQDQRVGAAELHTFEGKLHQKASWTRGLFVSNSGFTSEGLHAFGRGKRLVCMDGFDLYEMLERKIPLNHVLEQKVRKAGETGSPFVRVRDLFLV